MTNVCAAVMRLRPAKWLEKIKYYMPSYVGGIGMAWALNRRRASAKCNASKLLKYRSLRQFIKNKQKARGRGKRQLQASCMAGICNSHPLLASRTRIGASCA